MSREYPATSAALQPPSVALHGYALVFDGIIDEERELSALYAPLGARLETEEGALGKLSFSIRRVVDVGAWAQSGEDLLDLRKTGPFKGRGALLAAAKTSLQAAWEKGSSVDVAEIGHIARASNWSAIILAVALSPSPGALHASPAFRDEQIIMRRLQSSFGLVIWNASSSH